ncbi:MAG: aminoacetone oxidase family FAD-binding enzyme [Bacilli bacterium]|nr:aminoacetone oxidase family FAD-binding enzyme [Bacilli bacterium]
MKRIIIIGGGVAGITAAIKAKNANNEVTVLEKNKTCLKKLLITGNGHCNYFNDDYNYKHYYSNNLELVSKIITSESKKLLTDFYQSIGLVPRIKNGYYYPYSNQAYAVLNALIKEADIKGVKIINEVDVTNIKIADKFIVETNKENYIADKVIVATGSKAYPKTGSTGDGYRFAKILNHTVNNVYPALVQVVTDDKYLHELDGVRNDTKVTLLVDSKSIKEEVGELQFTNYGLSGICIYNLTLAINKYLEEGKEVKIKLNLLHGLNINNESDLDNYLSKQNKLLNKRTLVELLEEILNYKIVNALFKKYKINNDIIYDEISSDSKLELLNALVNYEVKVVGTKDFNNAQVCSGGLLLTELNTDTFESKLVKGLYFVGELIDITGECGGYNISFAVLSGLKAGINVGGIND